MEIYIYKHTSPSGKCYIGQTSDIKRRWREKSYKQCPKFFNAIQKYGWENFEHEIVCICHTSEEADEKERYYIQYYDSINNGYNITAGGYSLRGEENIMYGKSVLDFMTEEEIANWKQKLSEAHKGEKNGFYGKHHSEETIKKISAAKLGVSNPLNLSNEQRKAISERNKLMWTEEKRNEQSKKMTGENNPMYGREVTEEQRQYLRDKFTGEKSPKAKAIIIVDTLEDKEIYCACQKYVRDLIGMNHTHIGRYLNKDKLYHKRYMLKEVA